MKEKGNVLRTRSIAFGLAMPVVLVFATTVSVWAGPEQDTSRPREAPQSNPDKPPIPDSISRDMDTYDKRVALVQEETKKRIEAILRQAENKIGAVQAPIIRTIQERMAEAEKDNRPEDVLALRRVAKYVLSTAPVKPEVAKTAGVTIDTKGVLILGNYRYKLIREPATWIEARKQCKAWGGDLVCISDYTTNRALRALFEDVSAPFAWIGLASVKRGQWSWVSGTPPIYRNFQTRESESMANGNRCAGYRSSDGGWADFSPQDKFPYICQWKIN